MKREFVWSVFLFALTFFASSSAFDFVGQKIATNPVQKAATVSLIEETQPTPKQVENIRLAFVGDLMLDRGVKYSVNKNFAGDYTQLFSKVTDQLNSYDFLFANLEGPISALGQDQGGIYSFRMEPKVIPVLKSAGFDVLSVANNHVFNWGWSAFADTLQFLSDNNIIFVGRESDREKAINTKGVKIAFLGFSEFPAPGIATISEKNIRDAVSGARIRNDLVIVSFHFGEEYQAQPNAYQRKYAELSIDSGADLIIGHHPHVVQTLEQYKNAYIIYSLGNFIFDQYFSEETMQGGLLEVEINPESKQIKKATLKKVFLNKFFQIESIE